LPTEEDDDLKKIGRASAGLRLGRERERVGPEMAQAMERERKRFFL
jgi:hypothetical protein